VARSTVFVAVILGANRSVAIVTTPRLRRHRRSSTALPGCWSAHCRVSSSS
jgi:hypothetical protein